MPGKISENWKFRSIRREISQGYGAGTFSLIITFKTDLLVDFGLLLDFSLRGRAIIFVLPF